MNVVDSSAWLEYFAGSDDARHFAAAIEDSDRLITPSLCIFEVFKKVLLERSEHEALHAAAAMQMGSVIDLDLRIAMEAARLGIEHHLPLADSVILATARHHRATLWTQDGHFEGIEGVEFRRPGT